MSKQKETFLDTKTLVALGLLLFSWWGWDYYMKKKYPEIFKRTDVSLAKKKPEIKGVLREKDQAFSLIQKKHSEKELWFRGKNMDILFSSKGLGIKKLQLKKYSGRNREPIQFISGNSSLFSTDFSSNREVPFDIKKEGNIFVGVFSSSHEKIVKKVEVKEDIFALNVQIEIVPFQEKSIRSLSLSFSHPLPQEKHSGFFKMFFIYGLDVLKAFLLFEGQESKRLSEKDILFCEKTKPGFCENFPQDTKTGQQDSFYKNVESVALGGKYFGKAFMNKSSLLPSVQLVKDNYFASAFVTYDFLHSKKQNLEYRIFLGPKSLKNLENLGGGLRQWLDFGFFSWMARPLLLFLIGLYKFCHNWGLAIILLTFVIRLALLPINIKSYKSMKLMQKIQPELKEIRETYKSDPKEMNQKVMALMKKNKVNPLGGCLPMFVQLPVFFALYRVLGESIKLYQSPFVFWIKDLSLKDPFFVYPVLAGLVLFIQQSITPMNLPKEQARLIKMMPLVFSVFMLNLPSGLTLYIFVSGLFGLVQQLFFVKLNST